MANTKRALLTSVLAIVACVAMLIGSTFAWFTDTASTGVNKIQAGNLKIDIVDEAGNSLKNTTLDFVKSPDAPAGEKILWEPGCTYKLPTFRIVNKGNLALKYKVVINGVDGDAKLLEAIDFFVKKGNAGETKLEGWEGVLLPKGAERKLDTEEVEETASITISGHMKKEAGNVYQGLSIEGISIKVYATQYTYESDSFNDQYDAKATYYPVIDADGMKDALINGGIIEVDADIDTGKETLKVLKDTTLNMNGKTIENTENIWIDDSGSDGNWSVISVRSGAKLTIDGNGTFKAKENDAMAVDVQGGATVTIKNGTFIGNMDAVYVEKGKAIIEGGFFDIQQKASGTGEAQYRFMLNCYDANYKNGKAKITVRGGTFVNFDPSNNAAEGAGTNFVEAGYSVVAEKHGSDTWYKVVKTPEGQLTTTEKLNGALELGNIETDDNGKKKQVAVLMGDNEAADIAYSEHSSGYTGKGVLLGSTKLNKYGIAPAGVGEYSFLFSNGTINSAATGYASIDGYKNTSVYMLLPANSNVTFENMTFNGVVSFDIQKYTSPWSNLNSLTFKNCTFNGIIIGTCPASNVTFDGCTFNSYTNTTSANNSNPIWWREDTEGNGANANPIKTFTFVNNKVTGTRPVKIERIGKTVSPVFTIKNNAFDISKQAGDKETKNMAINIGMGENPNQPFTLIDDGNTVSANTAALYTASLTGGSNWYKETSGMKVLDGEGNAKVITAMVWKTTTGATFELKSVD